MNCFTETFRAMGSPCELRLYAKSPEQSAHAATQARTAVEVLEARYSRYRPESLLSRINAAAGTAARIEVDDETAGLLDYAAQAWKQSDGLFDVTSGILRRVWDFKSQRVPAQEKIDALLPLIGWQRVEWRRPFVRLPHAGMELDFGGYVKEYATDVAAAACLGAEIKHGLVELGGDIRVIGPHPDGSPWRIGIRHPRAPETAIAYVEASEGAVASSGDYERCMIVDGRRYCHILNPKTGWPASGLAAVSVTAPQCLIAGTATTIAMLNEKAGRGWLDELGLPYLVVDAEMQVSGSVAWSRAAPVEAAQYAAQGPT